MADIPSDSFFKISIFFTCRQLDDQKFAGLFRESLAIQVLLAFFGWRGESKVTKLWLFRESNHKFWLHRKWKVNFEFGHCKRSCQMAHMDNCCRGVRQCDWGWDYRLLRNKLLGLWTGSGTIALGVSVTVITGSLGSVAVITGSLGSLSDCGLFRFLRSNCSSLLLGSLGSSSTFGTLVLVSIEALLPFRFFGKFLQQAAHLQRH